MSRKCLTHKQVWARRVILWVGAFALAVYSYHLASVQSEKLQQIQLENYRAKQILLENQVQDASIVKQVRDALIDSLDFGYSILDEEGLVQEWNPALERWTGKTASQMKGNTLQAVMPEEYWPEHREQFVAAIEDLKANGGTSPYFGKAIKIECSIIRDNGKQMKLVVSVRFYQLKDGKWAASAMMDRASRVLELKVGE